MQQVDRTYVRWSGRKLTYFSGCDYFRLSTHPRVENALVAGLKRYGLSVSASRLTTGNHKIYEELEQELAHFFDADSALLTPTGYVTNLIVAQALAGQFSHALIDEAAHPSLVDAAKILECPTLKFTHRSVSALSSAIARCGPEAKILLLTDGMFARDGAVAPVNEYARVLPTDAALLVDDAHGAGVLGARSRGALEHTRSSNRNVILTITLSKAFGTYGGAILGPRALRKRILQKSHLFIGSTPLPLPIAHAAREALKVLKADKGFRMRLTENVACVKSNLKASGLALSDTPGPIVALKTKDPPASNHLKRLLLKAGIFPPLIKYPGAPPAGYFRFVISSEHTRQQLNTLVRTLAANADSFSPLE